MIEFRHKHGALRQGKFLNHEELIWHSSEPHQPDWGSRVVAFTLPDFKNGYSLYIAFNAGYHHLTLTLPAKETPWHRVVDTSQPPPLDFIEEKDLKPHTEPTYTLPPNSALLMKRFIKEV